MENRYFFQIVKGKYDKETSIYNVINYIRNPQKTPHGISNIHANEIEKMTEEFLQVQKLYRNEKGKRIRHLFIGFPEDCTLSYKAYARIAFQIADCFKNHQIVFALHEFNNNLEPCAKHIHFALNPINYKTGKRIKIDKKRLRNLHKQIDTILAKYSNN